MVLIGLTPHDTCLFPLLRVLKPNLKPNPTLQWFKGFILKYFRINISFDLVTFQGTKVLRDFQRRKYQRLKWQEKRINGERIVVTKKEKTIKETSQLHLQRNAGNLKFKPK